MQRKGKNKTGSLFSGFHSKYEEDIVWPLAIRGFHWSLVVLVFLTLLTSLRDKWIDEHMLFGFGAFILVIWRTFYGFTGPFHTQFKSFIVSPKKLASYLKKLFSFNPPYVSGHNPPHGWMILAIIVVVISNFFLGLAVFWGEENEGLYASLLSFQTGELVKELHEVLGALFLAMIATHLCGVVFDSFIHGKNLVKGMVRGEKSLQTSSVEKPQSAFSLRLSALFIVSLLFAATLFFQTVYARKNVLDLSPGGAGWTTWQEECSGCHELFHPSLLPTVVWEKIMQDLENHFGDDASLEKEEMKEIFNFLKEFSAEKSSTEAAYKIGKSIKGNTAILRITDSPYWMSKHQHIERSVYERKTIRSKTVCSSCHLDALSGMYEDNNIHIPPA